ncbi:protein kinase [Nannocystis sp. SCPEA4]|uniref:protein kinase domain-containing protein n=1 Tax=Nannocystis sp. SCPEA4 TaxID=2996787 RepID=UPI00226FFD83|nr:protein kinase [Nannocystis sp. SCPEA4]MCY1062794.1 protein kinase [Nannocystis sp. SCPEA4]
MPQLAARPALPASHVVRAAQNRLLDRIAGAPEPTKPDHGLPSVLDTPTSWPGPTHAPGQPDSDDRYEFGEAFATGGLGVVRRARDRRLGRTVAVKELLRTDAAAEHRFALEAAITARLQHPGIVPLYDIGRHATGEPYYCMKLVEGQTLEHEIRRRPQLADRLALIEHVIAAADAVAYAHRHGVIHRDLKPANILVGELGEAVVIDWGLAKDTTGAIADTLSEPPPTPTANGTISTMTEHGTVLGTLRYMPPEQARGEAVDARGDVFALGAVLYHVLAGEPPYTGVDPRVLATRVAEGAIDDLRRLCPDAPRELVAIAQRAMAPRPDDRYPGAEALADDLRRFLTGRLVGAHRYSTGEVVRLWLRRHRAVVGVAAASLAALAVGGAVAVQNIRHQRDAAASARTAAESAQTAAESALVVARRQVGEALLAQARTALDVDLAGALTTLAQLDLSEQTVARRARLLALAAESRGAPSRVLRGHKRPVQQVVALSDGALVSVDVAGDVWKWDPRAGTGAPLFDLGEQGVVLAAARDVPAFAAIGSRSARVERDGASQVVDTSAAERSVLHADEYRWQMSPGGETLAALREPVTLKGDARPPAYLWDMSQRTATLTVIPGKSGVGAALGPDGRTVAHDDPDRAAFLHADGKSTAMPAIQTPLEFSSSGAHLVAWAADEPPSQVAYTLATREVHPLGRQVMALAPDDHAVVVDFDSFTEQAELSLRSLATGEPRWTRTPVDSTSVQEWGLAGKFDVVVDPHGDGLALRTPEYWLLGSQTDGALPRRLDTGARRHAVWTTGGRFALAHHTEIHVWDPAPVHPGAQGLADLEVDVVSRDGTRALVHTTADPTPRLRNMSDGTSSEVACRIGVEVTRHTVIGLGNGWGDDGVREAVDAQGRVLYVDADGKACLADAAGAHVFALPDSTDHLALADAGPALAAGFADGAVLVWRDVAATPRRWELGAAIAEIALTPAGDGVVAHTRAGKVFALTPADDVPREIAVLDPGPPPTFFHPRAAVAVIPLPGQDAIAIHDFVAGTTKRRELILPTAPVAAYAPSGATLAVAVAGRRVLLLHGADDPGRELVLPDEARGLAFVGEDELAVLGESGALIRVDTVIGESAVIREGWTEPFTDWSVHFRMNLVAAPSGATHLLAETYFPVTTHPADAVPRGEALAEWLQTRRAGLAGG